MIEAENKYPTIIEGTYKIFIEHGIRNISMDDICRMLGISKKTLYQFVENKGDLLKKMSQYIQETIRKRMEELSKSGLNAIDVLLEMSKIANAKHYRINSMITHEFRKYYPQIFEEYLCIKKDLLIQNIKKNLEQGIKEGLYRQDLNKDIIAHLYFKKIEDFHNPELTDLQHFSFENVFEVMFENHIRGIANQNGIEYFENQKKKLNFNI
jgi:TetR/AcrR family transcriptional regulator, cholesterol catabolism regulator